MSLGKRIAIAIAIAAGLYAISLGIGGALYATDNIPLGPTHNDCENFREDIAEEQGIDEEDVEQEDIKALAEECLAEHVFEDQSEPFRTEYVIWGMWPGVVCAVIFLLWPAWSRILHNQEVAEGDPHE
jgi:hypothetical protein